MEATWGDTVRVSADAPSIMRPGCIAAVVGVTDVITPEQAERYGTPVGSRVLSIEFVDGVTIEVHDKWVHVE